ncbi:MAG: right-handed parallel beta-helix repeat-containing protein [Acutalibacteraceae bacterium]|nr:right-handed parallel beta-helix repeat-containing protein [Acutalibacteraceae bacterium]
MKEKRVTKRAIFASLLSVAVCTSMLIGTSYAWFTDSVTSANNKIQAGTLKIDMLVKGGDTGFTNYTSVKTNSDKIFNYDKWEPGYTSWTNVKVKNEGNLALKYTLRFVSDDDLSAAKLAEVIDVYYAPAEVNKPDTRPDLTQAQYNAYYLGTLADVFSGKVAPINDTLLAEDIASTSYDDREDYATIVLKMKESAGNEYQNEALPAFDLQLMAMQYAYEKDTFDEHYDDKANGIPDHPEWGNLNTSASAKAVAGEATVVDAVGAKLTIPADKVAADTQVSLVVGPGTMNPSITVGDKNTAMTYDITVTPVDNTVLKKVELNIGKAKTGLVVYHDDTAMAKLTDAANTTDEGYFYDPATGILTIWSKTFSPFTIITAKPASVVFSAEKEEATAAVAEAVAAAESGDTVVLGSGEAVIPTNIPENVMIKGKEDGSTVLDTTSISGQNTGTLDDVAVENVTFTSSNTETWDGIISHKTTLTDTTFDNCTFDATKDNRSNAIYGGTINGETVFENCEIKADVYGINFSYVNGTLVLRNCDITGWNSFGGAKTAGGESKVIVENCRFHKGDYGVLRFYQNAEVKNCTFDDDFEGLDCNADGKTITITNCTGLDGKIYNNSTHTNTWIVDGIDISADVTSW